MCNQPDFTALLFEFCTGYIGSGINLQSRQLGYQAPSTAAIKTPGMTIYKVVKRRIYAGSFRIASRFNIACKFEVKVKVFQLCAQCEKTLSYEIQQVTCRLSLKDVGSQALTPVVT